MDAGRRIPGRHRRHQVEGRLEERDRRRGYTLVQQAVGADGVTRAFIVAGRIVMSVVMCMPVVRLHGDGVLDVVKFTHGGQDRLQQYAHRNHHQQGVVQKTAVEANALHGCM